MASGEAGAAWYSWVGWATILESEMDGSGLSFVTHRRKKRCQSSRTAFRLQSRFSSSGPVQDTHTTTHKQHQRLLASDIDRQTTSLPNTSETGIRSSITASKTLRDMRP